MLRLDHEKHASPNDSRNSCFRILLGLSLQMAYRKEQKEEIIMPETYCWFALVIVLIIIEAITTELVTIWFAGGAVLALVLSAFGAPLWAQTGTFAAASIALLLLTRPLVKKYIKKGAGENGLDRMIGKQGITTEEINNLAGTGEVQVDGQYWMARTENNNLTIKKDQVIMVRQIHGVRLIVEPVAKEDDTATENIDNISE